MADDMVNRGVKGVSLCAEITLDAVDAARWSSVFSSDRLDEAVVRMRAGSTGYALSRDEASRHLEKLPELGR